MFGLQPKVATTKLRQSQFSLSVFNQPNFLGPVWIQGANS